MAKELFYHRCSSAGQCADRATVKAEEMGISSDYVFVDYVTGVIEAEKRKAFSAMLEIAEAGDTINIFTISRLGRKASVVFNALELLKERDITLNVIDLNVNSRDKAFNIVVGIFASISEAEREDIKEAQRQGIEAKKAMGLKCGGRPSIPDAVMMAAVSDYLKAQKPVSAICSDYSISPSKLYKYMKANNISR